MEPIANQVGMPLFGATRGGSHYFAAHESQVDTTESAPGAAGDFTHEQIEYGDYDPQAAAALPPVLRLIRTVGNINTGVTYELKSFESGSLPPYVALSYTWGDVRKRALVFINGLQLRVTTNLFVMLAQLPRTTISSNWLWVDAICINQEDVQDRNYQVQAMGSIFGKAWTTVIWLGLSDTVKNRQATEAFGAIMESTVVGLTGPELQDTDMYRRRQRGS
ncbi:hypothetical protein LTR85_000831 [Meristemomyces frigidus]|nr:hypothetical protein LTR85_000831 [Meristemomyces frigidus]